MKLNYFDLLSPVPIRVQNICSVVSPTLRNISFIGYETYQYYISILLMDLKSYLSATGQYEKYTQFTEEEKSRINVFDIMTLTTQSCELLREALDFFIKEVLIYSSSHNGFIVRDNDIDVGIITRDNFSYVKELILQRNYIKSNEEDLSKIKSKKALEIIKKLQKGRNKKTAQIKSDKNMELGNIISAVANKSNSLNMLNIWDLTIYQLWDSFSRISNNNIYDIQSMSVAAWGNKDNYFDATAWFKIIDINN